MTVLAPTASTEVLAGLLPALAAVPPHRMLYLAAALFAIGLVGVTCRRNVLIMLLSVEILLNAANVAFVGFSRIHGDVTGQTFVFFSMAIAAAEVAVGLAIVIAIYRLRRGVDADDAGALGERHLGEIPPISPEGPETADPHHHDPHDHDAHAHDAHDDGHDHAGHGGHEGQDGHARPVAAVDGHATAGEAHR